MKKNTYSESEISDIISQAARLQAMEGTIGQEGLTLDELKQWLLIRVLILVL